MNVIEHSATTFTHTRCPECREAQQKRESATRKLYLAFKQAPGGGEAIRDFRREDGTNEEEAARSGHASRSLPAITKSAGEEKPGQHGT